MRTEQAEALIVGMGGKGGARGAGFLAPHLFPTGTVDRLGIAAERGDFLVGKAVRQKEIALFVKGLELRRAQLHRGL